TQPGICTDGLAHLGHDLLDLRRGHGRSSLIVCDCPRNLIRRGRIHIQDVAILLQQGPAGDIMAAIENHKTPGLVTTAPSAKERRDLRGHVCFVVHFAVLIFIVAGWAVPFAPALWLYLAFIPAVAIQWQFNRNSCVLNNAESWLRYGTWRSERNAEE